MRLLLLTSVYPSPRRPNKGTFNREFVTALRGAGDDLRVIVPVPWTDLIRLRPAAKPETGTTYKTWWYPPRFDHARHHHWMRHTIAAAAARITADWHPDAVLGYWAHPDGTVALGVARQLGVPGILLVGGSDIQLLTRQTARKSIIVDTLLAADQIFAVGAQLRHRVIDLGVPADRVNTFHRGVDTGRFHPGPQSLARQELGLDASQPIFLWVGRMVPVKGLDILLDAWARVYDHPRKPLLVLIGDGEERNAVERAAAHGGDSVKVIGAVAFDRLPTWYRAADTVVLSSLSEGVPNVLVEGLACGTPFIASDVGSISSLVSGPSVLVPPGDAAALAEAMVHRMDQSPPPRSDAPVLDRAMAVRVFRDDLRAVLQRRSSGAAAA